MGTLKSGELEKALAAGRPPASDRFLMHGPESGLARDLAAQLVAAVKKSSGQDVDVITLDDAELAEAPDRPAVELLTPSMFGDPKVVKITAGPRLKADIVERLLEAPKLEGMLIVLADELRKDAKLRKLFEGAPGAYAIGCYADGAGDLATMVDEVLGANGLQIDRETKSLLISQLGADRRLSRMEVEKLALYCAGRDVVKAQDIEAISGDAAATALDDVVMAAMAGDAARAIAHFDRLVGAGQSEQAVLLAVQRHLHRLYALALKVDGGQTPEQAVRAARPPVFFKLQGAMTAQLKRWPASRVGQALQRTGATIERCRTAPSLEATSAPQLLLGLASMAGRRR
ncbi:MAG: DNA polymerase III subunit delta [Pseudomonadota bacterium]